METKRRHSSKDVAKLAGVSQTTVSFVLTNRQDQLIPEETRKRVLDAAKQLRYRPNRLVNGFIRGKTQLCAVVVPNFDFEHNARILQGISEECTHNDYRMIVSHYTGDPEIEHREISRFQEHRVDGIISIAAYTSGAENAIWLEDALETGLPCVMIDDSSFAGQVDSVISDDVIGSVLAVEYLISKGHKRIGHVMGFPDTSTARDRLLGYKTALKKAGIVVDEGIVVGATYDPLRAGPDIERLIEHPRRPTSIFAANDLLAAAVLRECKKHDIRVPEDMEVVGYADHTSSEYLNISTVSQQPTEMGRVAARRLFERIKDPSIQPEVIKVPVNFITRGSTRS